MLKKESRNHVEIASKCSNESRFTFRIYFVNIKRCQWHLFGSVARNEPDAADIDLMILCKSDEQADTLRRVIDPDTLALPLHLALLTFDEAAAIDAVRVQRSLAIFP